MRARETTFLQAFWKPMNLLIMNNFYDEIKAELARIFHDNSPITVTIGDDGTLLVSTIEEPTIADPCNDPKKSYLALKKILSLPDNHPNAGFVSETAYMALIC